MPVAISMILLWEVQWWIGGGAPLDPNAFIFMHFLAKKEQNNRLVAPSGELAPPLRNPGSSTEVVKYFQVYFIAIISIK